MHPRVDDLDVVSLGKMLSDVIPDLSLLLTRTLTRTITITLALTLTLTLTRILSFIINMMDPLEPRVCVVPPWTFIMCSEHPPIYRSSAIGSRFHMFVEAWHANAQGIAESSLAHGPPQELLSCIDPSLVSGRASTI